MRGSILYLAVAVVAVGASVFADDSRVAERVAEALEAYHEGAADNEGVLRVVRRELGIGGEADG